MQMTDCIFFNLCAKCGKLKNMKFLHKKNDIPKNGIFDDAIKNENIKT